MAKKTKWVQMTHDKIPHTAEDPQTVTRKAYDEVWSKKGWALVENSEVVLTEGADEAADGEPVADEATEAQKAKDAKKAAAAAGSNQ